MNTYTPKYMKTSQKIHKTPCKIQSCIPRVHSCAIPLHRNMGLFWENVGLFRENTFCQENLGLEGGKAFTLGSLKLQVSFAKEPY